MAKSAVYSKEFFETRKTDIRLSATTLVPIVLEYVHPQSVIDVGCGTGEWLQAFQENAATDIFGIDGAYVDRNLLVIPQDKFIALDLSKPFTFDRTYDLVISLEVAEHIAPEGASSFIQSLTQLAPVILFSAAIPLQGGTHHVNEQWPDYWVKLFKARGYVPVDALRKRIWSNRNIEFWYRQNVMFFCTEQYLSRNSTLEQEYKATNMDMLSLVHPDMYMLKYISPGKSPLALTLSLPKRAARKIYRSFFAVVQKSWR